MAIGDFLSEGQPIPAGSAAIGKTSVSTLPSWYTNYAQELLARQGGATATPYSTYSGPRVAPLTALERQAQTMGASAAGAYQPLLTEATEATRATMSGPGALSTAQPYLTAAGGSSAAMLPQFMNPYTEQVVNRIGEVGARTLREQILPEIEGRFIGAGQYGSTRQAEMVGRSLRDTMEGISAQQAQALSAGYGGALTASQEEMRRQAQLASTAGQIGTNERQAGFTGVERLAGLGETAQGLGIKGAGALSTLGATERGIGDQNLAVAYSDFLRQQGYPQAQIDTALATFKGLSGAAPAAEQEYGYQPLGYQPESTSTAGAIGGGLTGLAGLISEMNDAGWFK